MKTNAELGLLQTKKGHVIFVFLIRKKEIDLQVDYTVINFSSHLF